MTAFNVVRFRVKPGREQEFVDKHRDARTAFAGFRRGSLVKTGDRTYCIVGEWDSMAQLAAARPSMIALLDSFRDTLEDQGGGLGVHRSGVGRDRPRTALTAAFRAPPRGAAAGVPRGRRAARVECSPWRPRARTRTNPSSSPRWW